MILLGGGNEAVACAAVETMCTKAWAAYTVKKEYHWDQVSGYSPTWDKVRLSKISVALSARVVFWGKQDIPAAVNVA
eukprot:8421326-Ditylum_brightwellii.AAC.1